MIYNRMKYIYIFVIVFTCFAYKENTKQSFNPEYAIELQGEVQNNNKH